MLWITVTIRVTLLVWRSLHEENGRDPYRYLSPETSLDNVSQFPFTRLLLFHPPFRQTPRVFILRKYQVVEKYRNVTAFVDIFAHINMLRRNRRGIQPAEIEF